MSSGARVDKDREPLAAADGRRRSTDDGTGGGGGGIGIGAGFGVRKSRASTPVRYLKYYFSGLLIVFMVEIIMFLMSYSKFKAVWGFLVLFSIWCVIGIALLVWFTCREDATHDEQDARSVPLTVSELFLFQEPIRDHANGVPDVDAVAYKRHERRVRHVRIITVVMVASFLGALIGLGACTYFETYWSFTSPASDSSSSGSAGAAATQHAAWDNVNAETDPASMPGAKVIYFVQDIHPNNAHVGVYISGGTVYCAIPIEYPGDNSPSVKYWATAKGCCQMGNPYKSNCDVSGRLATVVSKDSEWQKAVGAALTANRNAGLSESSGMVLYVHLQSEGGFERTKYMSKITAWCIFGVVPPLWPAGLIVVLLIKIILDSCGCNTNAHENPDKCKCCS